MVLQKCKLRAFVSRLIWIGVLNAGIVHSVLAQSSNQSDQDKPDADRPLTLRLFTASETITYAENVSIDAWMNDLQTQDTTPGEYALTRNVSEVGFAIGPLSLAGFARREYLLHFSQDTFDLVYQDKNNRPFDTSRNYGINLEVSHVLTKGLKMGYDIKPLWGVTSRVEFNAFKAEEVLFGSLKGFLNSSNRKINGDLLLDYNYTEDVILDRPITPPASGRGHSVDIELWWQPIERVNSHFLIEDLYSAISWSHTPYTRATITTVRSYTDINGNTKRMPTISGRESFRDVHQKIPKHIKADTHYKITDAWRVEVAQESIDSLAFNRLTTTYNIGAKMEMGVGYDFTAKAPRLELRNRYVNLVISTDTINSEKTKFVSLNGELKIAF